jgi:PKD domain
VRGPPVLGRRPPRTALEGRIRAQAFPPTMRARGLTRTRFRRRQLGVAGVGIALAALVLIPSAIVAGLIVGVPPGSGRPVVTIGGAGPSVRINAELVCVAAVSETPRVCALAPLTLRFFATLSGGATASFYAWNFGDGSIPAFGASLNHTFPSCAAYIVSVTVWGGTGGVLSNSTGIYPCPI